MSYLPPELTITRQKNTLSGMFGKLTDSEHTLLAYSIELPWRNNQQNISCIPVGRYLCKWTWSPAFRRYMYLVTDVPGRSGIRIHKGSYAGATDYGFRADFLGCISFGRGYTQLGKQVILHTTAVTIADLEDALGKKDFWLNIVGEHSPIT